MCLSNYINTKVTYIWPQSIICNYASIYLINNNMWGKGPCTQGASLSSFINILHHQLKVAYMNIHNQCPTIASFTNYFANFKVIVIYIYTRLIYYYVTAWKCLKSCSVEWWWWWSGGGGPTKYFVTLNLIWGWVEAVTKAAFCPSVRMLLT
jgi:hypothetical protein